jgi:hypothetical protein
VGKLLDLFKGKAPMQCVEGKMIDLEIVGESAYQDHIRQVNGRAGGGDFEIVLQPEPRNPHDANAVAVVADGKPVGYLPRKMAVAWQA